ncbi:hypothetical protein Tco_1119453, partial [Tanacetum coccineum]
MIGSLEIIKKIDSNAYRLKLPSHIRCSDVFNVKHLLPYHGDSFDEDLVVNSRENFVYPRVNDAGPIGIRAEVPVKMPPRRNMPLTEAYEQEFEQRVMARMEEPRRNHIEDNRRWESRMRVNIPEFNKDTLNLEGFIDWIVAVEKVFEFKKVPENKRVSLIATKLR